jgi:hypothetical protein
LNRPTSSLLSKLSGVLTVHGSPLATGGTTGEHDKRGQYEGTDDNGDDGCGAHGPSFVSRVSS